jgi:hypothetical protein
MKKLKKVFTNSTATASTKGNSRLQRIHHRTGEPGPKNSKAEEAILAASPEELRQH